MAAADPRTALLEESTCSICRELFTDPVTLDCGHNFCLPCLEQSMNENLNAACPECSQAIEKEKEIKPNKRLSNIVKMVRELQTAPGSQCEEHGEKLQLFCETDVELLCVLCLGSGAHMHHCVTSMKEAAQEYKVKLQDWLCPLRKEEEYIRNSKVNEEKQFNTLRNEVRDKKQKIEAEIEGLGQLLREQEQSLNEKLEQLEKTIDEVENENIKKLSNQITSLQDLIADLEKKCKEPALDLLKDVRSTLERCNYVKFQGQEQELKQRKEKEAHIEFANIQKYEKEMNKYKGTRELRIVLVGKSGTGKSATGNSILGRREFTSRPSPKPVTSQCEERSCLRNGQQIIVVDTPGLLVHGIQENVILKEEIAKMCPHAIVLVIQADRFTKDDARAAQDIQALFGAEAARYMLLLFTRVEDLEADGTSLGDVIHSSGTRLGNVIRGCGNRYVAFSNQAPWARREEQARALISMVMGMLEDNGGSRYTTEMAQRAVKKVQRQGRESRRETE